MIRSMTGFGDASAQENGVHYFVELRSVNNKYCKVSLRLPESLQGLEPALDSLLRSKLSRGSITLTLKCTDTSEAAAYNINQKALQRYIDQLRSAPSVASGHVTLDAAALLELPGVLQPPADEEQRLTNARRACMPLIEESLTHLIAMRQREGIALGEELITRHAAIVERLEEIKTLAPRVVAEYERRLKERIEALLNEAGRRAEPGDLVREVAVYAEKTDIAEEITRLGEHMIHFAELIRSEDDRPLGRTMDFVAQEMLREANTIASKSPDARIGRLIVEIKGEIDRIKEQVQNAE